MLPPEVLVEADAVVPPEPDVLAGALAPVELEVPPDDPASAAVGSSLPGTAGLHAPSTQKPTTQQRMTAMLAIIRSGINDGR